MTGEPCGYTDDQIVAFVAGDLAEDEALAVALHLGECRECCDEAAEFIALDSALASSCAGHTIRCHTFRTPFARMYIAASDSGLVRISWQQKSAAAFTREMERRFPGWPVVRDGVTLADAERQMLEYFAGERSRFDVPVDLSALSPFERRVLEEARRIPFGQVIPYSELARRIGKPKAARAVGNALSHNPVAIVVPCHRVVRRDGSLGGYGGSVGHKRRLLGIEGREDLARAS